MNDQAEEKKNGSLARTLLATIAGAVGGAIFGALVLSNIPWLYYTLFDPEILKDGQWGMIYLISVPAGLVFGCLVGAVTAFLLARR